jgi:cytochrome c-type biogenesis protein CcmH/NrfF
MMKWVVGFILLAVGCASVPVEDAGEGRQAQSIVRTTNSPFCPGKSLDSCPSPRASEWRQDINEWVADGVAENEIRDRLQERVPGFDLSVAPVKSGWIIPAIAVLLSTVWLLLVGRALTAPAPPRRSRPPTDRASLDARLDEELARLD